MLQFLVSITAITDFRDVARRPDYVGLLSTDGWFPFGIRPSSVRSQAENSVMQMTCFRLIYFSLLVAQASLFFLWPHVFVLDSPELCRPSTQGALCRVLKGNLNGSQRTRFGFRAGFHACLL